MGRLGSRAARVVWGAAAAVCLWLLCPAPGGAKETDSFTHRYEALAFPAGEVDGRALSDFSEEFNELFQRVFSEVLAELNRENRRDGISCRAARARRRLFHRLSNGLGGPVLAGNRLRPAITHHPNRYQPEISASIYREFAPWRSLSLGLAAKFGHDLGPLFRFDFERVLVERGGSVARSQDGRLVVLGPRGIATPAVFQLRGHLPQVVEDDGRTFYLLGNGRALVASAGEVRRVTAVLVSSDKFSHFFNRSLGLFKRLGAGSEADWERVLERNHWLEVSLYGSKSTGVVAYGDLVANFQGLRFWVHLLGRGIDGRPLGDPLAPQGVAPLVRCSPEDGWQQARPFDIRDYLDAAWDEGVNCSRLRSRVLLRQVLRQIERLGRDDELGRAYDCPVDRELLAETAAGYGRFADWLINPGGHSALRSGGP